MKYNDYTDNRQKMTKYELEIDRLRQENDRLAKVISQCWCKYQVNLYFMLIFVNNSSFILYIKKKWFSIMNKIWFATFLVSMGKLKLKCKFSVFEQWPVFTVTGCKKIDFSVFYKLVYIYVLMIKNF